MVAEQIRALRHRDRLSQKELAKRLDVGQSTIAMWETGTNTPGYANLVKLAALFNVSVGDLTQGPLITAFDWDDGDIFRNLQQILLLLQQSPHTLSYKGRPLTRLMRSLFIENISCCLKTVELVYQSGRASQPISIETTPGENPDVLPESEDKR